MKKVILAIAVLVGVSTAGFSFNGEEANKTSVELVANSDLMFKLALDNVKEKSTLVIKDHFGQILYSANLPKTATYSKIFDLSGLADGNYSFVISNGKEVTVKPFEIATETKRLVTAVK